MTLTYGAGTRHQLRVYLAHSRSEAEGSATRYCAEMLVDYAYSCSVGKDHGDTVISSVTLVRWGADLGPAGWNAVTKESLRTGVPPETDPLRTPVRRSEVYFVRTVKVVHSETFLTVAQEYVKAPSLAAADRLWRTSSESLVELATDPVLVIPEPPR
jgi:hypothetical protein